MKVNASQMSRMVQNSMQGLIDWIVKEEAQKAADNVQRRIVNESMRYTADLKGLLEKDYMKIGEPEIYMIIQELPAKS